MCVSFVQQVCIACRARSQETMFCSEWRLTVWLSCLLVHMTLHPTSMERGVPETSTIRYTRQREKKKDKNHFCRDHDGSLPKRQIGAIIEAAWMMMM